jgi:hypothetical protein
MKFPVFFRARHSCSLAVSISTAALAAALDKVVIVASVSPSFSSVCLYSAVSRPTAARLSRRRFSSSTSWRRCSFSLSSSASVRLGRRDATHAASCETPGVASVVSRARRAITVDRGPGDRLTKQSNCSRTHDEQRFFRGSAERSRNLPHRDRPQASGKPRKSSRALSMTLSL